MNYQNFTFTSTHTHTHTDVSYYMDCAIDATDRVSVVYPLMRVKANPGTADAGAAVAWPDTEVAGGLSTKLSDCSFAFQSLDS